MIILEGLDNSGKTTLAQNLLRDFPALRYIKGTGHVPLGQALLQVSEAIRSYEPRLYDRYFPISERVYGPILRGKDILGPFTFDILRLTFRRDPLLIYCRPPLTTIQKWNGRAQMNGVQAHAVELLQRYDWLIGVMRELYVGGSHPIMEYDFTRKGSYEKVSSAVDAYLKTAELVFQTPEKENELL